MGVLAVQVALGSGEESCRTTSGSALRSHDPQQVVGLDGGLQQITSAPFGTVLLLVVALGLASYGAFCFLLARWVAPDGSTD